MPAAVNERSAAGFDLARISEHLLQRHGVRHVGVRNPLRGRYEHPPVTRCFLSS